MAQLSKLLSTPATNAGTRLCGKPELRQWLRDGPVDQAVASTIGPAARPVRAILFNKTENSNWALAWHQDRTISVRARAVVPGFDRWTVKAGLPHVEPPFHVIQAMVTARIHIDAVDQLNAPLLVAPRSHRRGRITEAEIETVVRSCGTTACLADEGDVWLYRTAILHASEAMQRPGSRRVLQIDYSAEDLPAPLEWLGIG